MAKFVFGENDEFHDRKETWVFNINRKYFSMMPAPYSADQRWRHMACPYSSELSGRSFIFLRHL